MARKENMVSKTSFESKNNLDLYKDTFTIQLEKLLEHVSNIKYVILFPIIVYHLYIKLFYLIFLLLRFQEVFKRLSETRTRERL